MQYQRTEPLAERYRLPLPDEAIDEIVAALNILDDLESQVQEAIARVERVVQHLINHLPVDEQLVVSRAMFGLDDDEEQ